MQAFSPDGVFIFTENIQESGNAWPPPDCHEKKDVFSQAACGGFKPTVRETIKSFRV